jgi:hypothetical protein
VFIRHKEIRHFDLFFFFRTSKTKVMNEVSSLTWNTIPRDDNTGGFFVHQAFFNGYISGVKFFTIYDTTYVVVGVYYDSVLDTHNVNSLVLRFNEDRVDISAWVGSRCTFLL